jgi:hypothetical protein
MLHKQACRDNRPPRACRAHDQPRGGEWPPFPRAGPAPSRRDRPSGWAESWPRRCASASIIEAAELLFLLSDPHALLLARRELGIDRGVEPIEYPEPAWWEVDPDVLSGKTIGGSTSENRSCAHPARSGAAPAVAFATLDAANSGSGGSALRRDRNVRRKPPCLDRFCDDVESLLRRVRLPPIAQRVSARTLDEQRVFICDLQDLRVKAIRLMGGCDLAEMRESM